MEESRFYYEDDKIDYEFWKLSKKLFQIKKYKEGLSVYARVLYAFLGDRISLSIKNRYLDEQKRVYIFFTREEAGDLLDITRKTAIKAFKELENMDLIEEKRLGQGRANVIYVKKLNVENEDILMCKKETSKRGKKEKEYVENLHTIKTNITKTEIINQNFENDDEEIELLNIIKNRSKLNEFSENEIEVLEEVIEALFYSNDFKVSGQVVSRTEVKAKLEKINKNNLQNILKIKKEKKSISNLKGYLIKVLYNSLDSKVIPINTESIGRDYTNFDFDSLYANKNW